MGKLWFVSRGLAGFCIGKWGKTMYRWHWSKYMFTRHADKWLSRDHEIENVIYVCSLCTDEPKNAGDHDNLDATAMKLNALTPPNELNNIQIMPLFYQIIHRQHSSSSENFPSYLVMKVLYTTQSEWKRNGDGVDTLCRGSVEGWLTKTGWKQKGQLETWFAKSGWDVNKMDQDSSNKDSTSNEKDETWQTRPYMGRSELV